MSYDLLVFEPAAVPAGSAEFDAWLGDLMRWEGGWDYNDPAICSPALRRWEAAMRRKFWALNGPHASRWGVWLRPNDFADFACTPIAIYVGFGWDRAEIAYATALENAGRYGLGLHDTSGTGEIHLPG